MSERIDHAADAVTNMKAVATYLESWEFAGAAAVAALAHTQAVLALVEQQRIANLIALGLAREEVIVIDAGLTTERRVSIGPLRANVREALGFK